MEPIVVLLLLSTVCVLLGAAMLIALHLVYGLRGKPRQGDVYFLCNLVGWGLVLSSLFLGSLLVFWPSVVVVIAAAVFGMMWCRHISAQQYALLDLMRVAAERFIPLVPVVQAFAQERSPFLRGRAVRLANLLAAGTPLPIGLAESEAVPPETLPIIRIGYEAGDVASALRQAAANRNSLDPVWQALLPKMGYIAFLPLFAIGIFFFLMLKIVPQFEKIFVDFGCRLPDMTAAVIHVARYFEVAWPLLWLFFMALWLLFLYLVARYGGWVRWDLPGTSWLLRRLDSAAILDALALVAQQQQPMTQGIATLAESYPKAAIRRRLFGVLLDVGGGADWCESLFRRGLLRRADLAVLQAAARVGNLPWALREMADSNRRRFAYRAHALVQVCFPPVVLLFGVVVMFVVVALFLPLIALIQTLV